MFRVPPNHRETNEWGSHPFNSSLVDAIYFGLNTTDQNKQKVMDTIGLADHEISLFEAIKHSDLLKIEFEELKTRENV